MAKVNAKVVAKSLSDSTGFVPNQVTVDEAAILENLGFRAFKMDFSGVTEGVTLEVELPNGASPNPEDRLMIQQEMDDDNNVVTATILQSVNRKTRGPVITVRSFAVEAGKLAKFDPFKIKVVEQDGPEGVVLVGELA